MYLGWCRCHGRHRRASLLASKVETSKGSHISCVGYIWDIGQGQPWRRQLNPLKDADERWEWIRNLVTGDFSSPLWEIHRNQICCCFYSSVFVFLSVTYIFHFCRWRKNCSLSRFLFMFRFLLLILCLFLFWGGEMLTGWRVVANWLLFWSVARNFSGM